MICVWSAALSGVSGVPVEVEVRLSSQLPRVDVVGLPEAAVRESVSRIRGAIAATGLSFPDRRVTVNLAPAELRKSGAALDLPIAVGVLGASGAIPPENLSGLAFLGELALDGRLRATRGTLAAVLALRDAGVRQVIVPEASASRAQHAPGIRVYVASHLTDVAKHLMGETRLPIADCVAGPAKSGTSGAADSACLSDVRGQAFAKRALEIAAAGGHALLMVGPPGTGKTLLARRLPGLLPPLREEERLETFAVQDAAGIVAAEAPIPDTPPFRAPHHSASSAGLLGGGQPIRPGEVSLAHHGVLFLDELPEFDRRCLESLREVLEQGVVRIARAGVSCTLPARCQLLAAANPCACGDYGSPGKDCRCDDAALARYRRRLSGPLIDRVDLVVKVGEVPWATLNGPPSGPTSMEVRDRVAAARQIQNQRGVAANASIPDPCLTRDVDASEDGLNLLGKAVEKFRLSARASRRVLRVARTIADLAGQKRTGRAEVGEALELRLER